MTSDVRYYRQPVIDQIARNVLKAYDWKLYMGQPVAIPIETMIEAHGLIIEYHYLRNTDRVCGETVFENAEIAIYDMAVKEYKTIIVKKGTIIIDARLLRKGAEGRLRFTLAHELAHWILHKNIFCGSQYSAAMIKGTLHNDNKLSSEADRMIEKQADLLATALIMPIKQVKKAFYELRSKYSDKTVLVAKMAETFDVSRQAMRICLTNHNLI